jgi:hypothetical protein
MTAAMATIQRVGDRRRWRSGSGEGSPDRSSGRSSNNMEIA